MSRFLLLPVFRSTDRLCLPGCFSGLSGLCVDFFLVGHRDEFYRYRKHRGVFVLRGHIFCEFHVIRTLEKFTDLPDEVYIDVISDSEESIHKHDAFAERVATLGELRQENQ